MNIKTVKKFMHPFDNSKVASYTVTFNDGSKPASVPISEDNRHYRMILEWVDAGNTIEAAD